MAIIKQTQLDRELKNKLERERQFKLNEKKLFEHLDRKGYAAKWDDDDNSLLIVRKSGSLLGSIDAINYNEIDLTTENGLLNAVATCADVITDAVNKSIKTRTDMHEKGYSEDQYDEYFLNEVVYK